MATLKRQKIGFQDQYRLMQVKSIAECSMGSMEHTSILLNFIKLPFERWHGISNNVICATSRASDQPAHSRSVIRTFASRLNILYKLLTEHHLGFLSLKGGCTGSSKSTFVKMPYCWKSHVMAHLSLRSLFCLFLSGCFTQALLHMRFWYSLSHIPLSFL